NAYIKSCGETMMKNYYFTREDIAQWCGDADYQKGLDYYKRGRIYQITYSDVLDRYDALANGSQNKNYLVSISCDKDGFIELTCNCPAYGIYNDFCKHVAAVMFNICDIEGDSDLTRFAHDDWLYSIEQYRSASRKADQLIALFDADNARQA